MDVAGADHALRAVGRIGRRPSWRRPARCWYPVREGCDHHHDEIDDSNREKRLRDADRARADQIHAFGPGHDHVGDVVRADDDDFPHLPGQLDVATPGCSDQIDRVDGAEVVGCTIEPADQGFLQRRSDHRAAAEAHDRHAGCHAAAVREPTDQGADRGYVAETEAAATDDAVTEIDQPELVLDDAEAANEIAPAPAQRGDDAHAAGADVLEPLAGKRGGETEKYDRDREDPDDVAEPPVLGGRCDDPEYPNQRRIVDAPRIDRADAQMYRDRHRWHEPAIESGTRGNALFGQQ
jgi:hypothetical protein